MDELPALGTDCHTHLFGPATQFPYQPDRAYTPSDASESDATAMLSALGLQRIVLVHASVYGENDRLLRGLEVLGDAARAIVVLGGHETSADLKEWKTKGVAGVRVNNVSNSDLSPEAVADNVAAASRQIADLGWHVQVFLSGDDLKAVLQKANELPTPLVIDHFGLLSTEPDDAELLDILLRQVSDGHCWVKLSASYRLTNLNETARQLTDLLVSANADRLLWGSDWPHPPAIRSAETRLVPQPPRDVDTKQLFSEFLANVPAKDLRQKILVDNPAALYHFT